MDRRRSHRAKRLWALLPPAAALLLCACAAGGKPGAMGTPPATVVADPPVASAAPADPAYNRTPPPVKMPALGDTQETREANGQSAMIDTSHLSEGYVGATATAGTRVKFIVAKDGATSDYEIDNDGTPNFYPINMGDGDYTFTVYIFLYEDDNGAPMYDPFLSVQGSAAVESEQAPYTVPTRLVRYDENSDCVRESYNVAAHSKTNLEVTQQVVAWIADNIVYDTAEAEAIGGKAVNYEPFPDEVYQTRTGICYDYASLAAAMLRANGIPTKLVKGQVAPTEGELIYHAWNMVWLEEDGWIVLDLPSNKGEWNRVDTTFLAGVGSGISSFIGNGENYTPTSEH